jgi:hypothetical protein
MNFLIGNLSGKTQEIKFYGSHLTVLLLDIRKAAG